MELQELEWIDINSSADRRQGRRPKERKTGYLDESDTEEWDIKEWNLEEWELHRENSPHGLESELLRQEKTSYRQQETARARRQQMPVDNRIERTTPVRKQTARTAPRPSASQKYAAQAITVPVQTSKRGTQAAAIPSAPRKKTAQGRQCKKKNKQLRMIKGLFLGTALLSATGILFGAALAANQILERIREKEKAHPAASMRIEEQDLPQDIRKWGQFYATPLERPELAVDLLTVNEYSRPGEALPEVKNIFIHYTANVGTTAQQNKSYFQSLAETHERSASAHFIIGFDGVIVQCIPTAEIAYAVKERNYDSLSIECCFLDESGVFTKETYQSLIELTAWLLHKYELEPEDVLRHYDEGGKNCPKYYVEHEDAWRQFLDDLARYMEDVSAG